MLQHIYPKYKWLPWKFQRSPKGFWSDIKNQQTYVQWLEQQLQITNKEDWYKVTLDQLDQHHGTWLGRHYGTVFTMLQHIYPKYKWLPWKFQHTPKGFWDEPSNLKQYLDTIASNLGIEVEALKTQPRHTFSGTSWLTMYTLQQALKLAYPDKNWSFSPLSSKGQIYLQQLLEKMFGTSTNIISNYRHPTIIHSKSNRSIELDLFIPDYQLAFEYQGFQHDFHTYWGTNLQKQKQRDQEKRELCQQYGILLVAIPELWSGLEDDLKATIYHHYYRKEHNNNNNNNDNNNSTSNNNNHDDDSKNLPSLPFPLPAEGNVILPSNAEIVNARRRVLNNNKSTKKYGQLFVLPKQYYGNMDPTGWWLSEKYDGFRVMWIATEQHFKTKGNRTIIPPAFIVSQLPIDKNLDGELWCVCVVWYCGIVVL
jgi:hypothetical protein